MKTRVHFQTYLTLFFLERKIFQAKVVKKIKTHVLCSITFRKSCRLCNNVENTVQPDRPHMTTCVRDEGSFSSNSPHPGRIACCPAPDRRPPSTKALHTIRGNNTSIVSSSWWWAYKCPKHVELITSAINHSVASSWFSSQFSVFVPRAAVIPKAIRRTTNMYWTKNACFILSTTLFHAFVIPTNI